MRIDFFISKDTQDAFGTSCEALIRNVGRATKAGTIQACQEIMEESLRQVPVDTGALASTAFIEGGIRDDIKGYTYYGVVGYAGSSGAAGKGHDAVNPRTGKLVSSYAVEAHEDLHALHVNGGKAKFLEDPVRQYAQGQFSRVAETYWATGIAGG